MAAVHEHPIHQRQPQPAPPPSTPVPPRPTWRKPAFAGAMAAVGTLYTGVLDPNTTHAFPLCPLRLFTGLDCPACGCLRSVHSLTRADVVGAADHNLIFTVAVPFVVIGWLVWLGRSMGWLTGPRRKPVPSWVLYAGLVLVAVFTVARNLPVAGLEWLDSAA